jgi:hypothetical protein
MAYQPEGGGTQFGSPWLSAKATSTNALRSAASSTGRMVRPDAVGPDGEEVLLIARW